MRRFVLLWGLAGLLVPVIIIIIGRLQGGAFRWPYLAVILWPSWIMAGALDSFENPPLSSIVIILAISNGLNVILYAAVGAAFWWMFYRFHK